ncbi:alkaline phosphatase D family protein [Crocosphaera sp.]|uniref:alkaline phosphatase D family protein n=1 Tax=Crocosphaera sp. TaxID=2729996 RepID=UPI0026227D00|nr:alkaline phosphatase D family protein [Crocosphaera sp.]MDJ0578485.1 alkaline phosphatase D family protein [Crocosphaera sp.]
MKVNPLTVGPIVGEATPAYLRVLGRGKNVPGVGVMRLAKTPDFQEELIRFVPLDDDFDLTGIAIFSNLSPETVYYYQYGWIETTIESTPCPLEWEEIKTYSVKILSINDTSPCSLIFGSCRYLLRKRGLILNQEESNQFQFKEKGDKTFQAIVEDHVNKNTVNQVIMCGDQIYADDLNVFLAAGELDDFLLRYRVAFSQPYIQDLMARIPTFMMLDDHEIEDNWPENASRKDLHGKYIYAMNAYTAYQANHSPLLPVENNKIQDYSNHYWYSYRDGCADFFVMDVRTERNLKQGKIISLEQMRALKTWLKDDSNRVKCVVSSVPLFPDAKDNNDKWGQFFKQRNELIDFIAGNKLKKVIFFSGDIHNSYTSILEGNGVKIIQIISSPFYWPLPIASGYPEDYNLCGSLENNESYLITTPSKFIREHNFTRVDINPNGLQVSVYNQNKKLLDSNYFSFDFLDYQLNLNSLKIDYQTSSLCLDEYCLTVSVDNYHTQYIDLQLSQDDIYSINQSFCFNKTITIKLFDKYNLSSEKCLGEYIITASNYDQEQDLLTCEFTEKNHKYTISYSLVKNDSISVKT